MARDNVIVTKVSSSDVDEHAAALAEWNQRYLQMMRGPFCGRLKHIEINDRLKIFRETTNLKISEYFVTPHNRTSLAIPLPGSAPVRCCHAEAGPGDLIVFRPGEGYHLECRGAFDVIGIEIDDDGEAAALDNAVNVLHADPDVRDFLQSTIEKLDRDCGNLDVAISPHLATLVKDRCFSLLQTAPVSEAPMPRSRERTQLVARARSIIDQTCREPISVQDLVRQLDTSTRTLEYSFKDVLNTTPAAYIKIVRLNEARRAIRSTAGKTVTDVAVNWGFWHFGRFASDYRKLFGELPSETRIARRAFDS